MSYKRAAFKFNRDSFIQPNGGITVRAFMYSFGRPSNARALLESSGMYIPFKTFHSWMQFNAMPKQAYEVLKTLKDEGLAATQIAEVKKDENEILGFDIYYNEMLVGKFDVARNWKVVVRKRK